MRYNPNSVSLNQITCNQIVNNVLKFLHGAEVALGAPDLGPEIMQWL